MFTIAVPHDLAQELEADSLGEVLEFRGGIVSATVEVLENAAVVIALVQTAATATQFIKRLQRRIKPGQPKFVLQLTLSTTGGRAQLEVTEDGDPEALAEALLAMAAGTGTGTGTGTSAG